MSDLSDFKRQVHEPLEKRANELRATAAFLARRLTHQAGCNGASSDALVAAAATGGMVPEDVYPLDNGDFARCCEAYALAPPHLRVKMLAQLVDWGEALLLREAQRGR